MEFRSTTTQYWKTIPLFSAVLIIGSCVPLAHAKDNCYNSIYQFGDSLADTGNLILSGPGILSSITELPYGETYFNKSTGRCSNGRLVIDFIAKAFGLSFLPPYLSRLADYSSGVNFAVAGATALDASFFEKRQIPIITNLSLNTQIEWFKDYKKKYCSSTEDCEGHFENSLFVLGEIGGNDLNSPFSLGMSIEKALIEQNAKLFLVPGNLPIGCSPSYLSAGSINSSADCDDIGCLIKFNNFSQSNNHLLRIMLQDVQRDHPDVSIVYADYYSAAIRILRNPKKYGLQKNVLRVCCGKGGKYNYSPPLNCDRNATLCSNPKQYFNWDGVHLTETAYKAIAHMLINGKFTSPPLNMVNKNCRNPERI
ncbi:GDSL esterase/lipase At5g45910 isoform X2 [Cryptomeria japonica]|uniref:GDSL esterase/lipase At5g45910 isoform X2 n=1 Tax=Cryptomeria japonica TaxID=3369 RepID=UPI0027DA0810|nr:GDSL esterase/lipase At5g45910 isoform X2 [Cryptomeria japonica]